MHRRKCMKRRGVFSKRLKSIMKCLCSADQLGVDEVVHSSETLVSKDHSTGGFSSQNGDYVQRFETMDIEEAESSLRDGVCLNYEEARALLGRLEYQRGNVEAALRVFDGICLTSLAPKIAIAIAKRIERRRSNTHTNAPPMSIHAVSLLVEAIYLKARALQDLWRYKEAAQTCNIILDTLESALPDGWPKNIAIDKKLQETICKAVELLPELWKLAAIFQEAISSYRRALIGHWNLDSITISRIQKEFAIFLLYGGCEANPRDSLSQMDGSFIPRNNVEEAILLLMILLRKFALKIVEWDSSIIYLLTFALSVSGQYSSLAGQVEELMPGVLERKEQNYTLALCYLAQGDDFTALNLLKILLSPAGDPNSLKGLLLASRICAENCDHAEEGVSFARRALSSSHGHCNQLDGVANSFLGTSFSTLARSSVSDSERVSRQSKALEVLEKAKKLTLGKDSRVLYNLSLENAEQRKLDLALCYAKQLLKQEAGSNVNGWTHLARILSAQKRFVDAEAIINAALEQTEKWNQGELLQIKAKLQIAQGQLKNAVETYSHILTIIQLQTKISGFESRKGGKNNRSLELRTWYDLTNVYINMLQWRDAEICLSKLKAISQCSALEWHAAGRLYEAKGLQREALGAYFKALSVEPSHVSSLVSTAILLRQLGVRPLSIVRSFLTNALQLDRTNHIAWFNLGSIYVAEGSRWALEAAESFQASALLEETAPVEPFRRPCP